MRPWPEGFRGPCYERGSQWLDSTHGCQFHTHADGLSARALRRLVASVRLTPWVPITPLKHIKMCSALVMRRQLVQIQPSAPNMPFKL